MLEITAGRLAGIARRAARRAPMEVLEHAAISIPAGILGDCKGIKFRKRQVTVLAQEDWEAAARDVGAPGLPWTCRRANLLVQGLALPHAKGSILAVGPVRLEVTGQTYPCVRMDEVCAGLLKALARDWRGGLTCTVVEGGEIRISDPVVVLGARQRELPLPLPG